MNTLTNDKRINPLWWILLAIMLLSFAARQANAQYISKSEFLEPRLNIDKKKPGNPKNWQYLVGGGLIFIGGMADGYNQVVRHHYYKFEEKHPNHNEFFWGPEQWKNKWKLDENGDIIPNPNDGFLQPNYVEKFWGSSRWFVGFTDAHHLTRNIDVFATLSGATIIQINSPVKKWWEYGLEIVGMFVVRSMGFTLVHDVYYK